MIESREQEWIVSRDGEKLTRRIVDLRGDGYVCISRAGEVCFDG